MDDTTLQRALAEVFRRPVHASGGRLGGGEPCRYPEEEQALTAAPVGRVQAFRAGRLHARRALASLGVEACALPVGPDRGPVWPAGVVGSITHDADWAAAAVMSRVNLAGVGLDIEQTGRITPLLEYRLFTANERRRLAACGDAYALLSTVLFSVKEAVYKAVSSAGGGWLGFQQVEVEAEPGRAIAGVRILTEPGQGLADSFLARWSACGRSVLAGVVLPAP